MIALASSTEPITGVISDDFRKRLSPRGIALTLISCSDEISTYVRSVVGIRRVAAPSCSIAIGCHIMRPAEPRGKRRPAVGRHSGDVTTPGGRSNTQPRNVAWHQALLTRGGSFDDMNLGKTFTPLRPIPLGMQSQYADIELEKETIGAAFKVPWPFDLEAKGRRHGALPPTEHHPSEWCIPLSESESIPR